MSESAYDEAMATANAAGYAGGSAAAVIRDLDGRLRALEAAARAYFETRDARRITAANLRTAEALYNRSGGDPRAARAADAALARDSEALASERQAEARLAALLSREPAADVEVSRG